MSVKRFKNEEKFNNKNFEIKNFGVLYVLEIINELDMLIRARYPLLYIVSNEEDRVIREIKTITGDALWIWSYITGFRKNGKGIVSEKTRDPLEALRFINNSRGRGIYILLDYHTFLEDGSPDIIRFFRELTKILKGTEKNVVIISSILTIPAELEKEITVLDFPLPEKDEISKLYDDIVEDVESEGVIPKINGNKQHVIRALTGLTEDEIANVLYKSIIKHRAFNIDTIIEIKKQIIRKTGSLEYYHTSDSIDDVGGYDIFKEWIIKRGNAFSDEARDFGVPFPKGVLLLGVQGCGKSLLCKCVSSLWNFPLLRLDMGSIFSGIVGSSEDNMSKALKLAVAVSPCVLWIDEIEKAFSGVGSSNFSDGGTTDRVVASFLTFLQENKAPVFIMATANGIKNLPPALLRKGRIDEIFWMDLPNPLERTDIFKIHIKKRGRNIEDYNIPALVDISNGFSGAEIEASIISGLYDAFDDGIELCNDHIVNNLNITVPLSTTMAEPINELRTWANARARVASTRYENPTEKRAINL
ncbi:hypothetical protein LCGC14_0795760 [marine sediment metagenome]|uniref:Uncharacterized AAA domain-containing protein ycf46 n=1 Tax=marine sediment metagenome TaxID=412755 RepID=A0A0F9QAY1_9ZZZZ